MSKQSQLSKHPTKGFRLSLSYYTTPEGNRSPKVWWLGHDEWAARFGVDLVRACYERDVLSEGLTDWSPKALEACRVVLQRNREQCRSHLANTLRVMAKRGYELTPASAEKAATKVVDVQAAAPKGEATLYAAIDAYMESFKAKRRAESHKRRAEEVLKQNLKKARHDCPLSEIDYLWIDRLCDYYKGRPVLKNGRKMKPGTVKVILQYCRQFFAWLDDTGYGKWEGPHKLMKPFRVRTTDLMTPVELRATSTIQQFDYPTLKKLYAVASDFQKMLMLTALFTGATQQELAVMEQSEFDLDAGTLHHFRNKTKVEGRYWLPPELVTLLKASFRARKDDPLAFRTSDGNPLVRYQEGRRTLDAVRQSWDDLRRAADTPQTLSFKYLRKFLADWMTRNGGETMGQVALSHARRTVLSQHYSTARDFETFNELQKKMRAELLAAGVLPAAGVKAAT